MELQRAAEKEVETCQEEAKDIKKMTDPVMHWISCYEKLILKFDDMEKAIHSEFKYFI